MHINGKNNYNEIENLVYELKSYIENQYLQNIYHYNNIWLFKFKTKSIVYEHGAGLFIGTFTEREKNLHSICIKIRKELRGKKLFRLNIVDDDKTIIFDFGIYKIVIELYAKGNIILLDSNNKVEVLTRANPNCYHGMIYKFNDLKLFDNYITSKYKWKNKNSEFIESTDDFDFNNVIEALEKLWICKYKKKIVKIKSKKKKFTKEDSIKNQVKGFNKKINKLEKQINVENINFENIDFKKLEDLHTKRKKLEKKKNKANEYLEEEKRNVKTKKKKKKEKIILEKDNWYQKYNWFYSKNNFLVIGGKSADDNEEIYSKYLDKNDIVLHTEEPGSGLFVIKCNDKIPDVVDIDEAAEAVIAFLVNGIHLIVEVKYFM